MNPSAHNLALATGLLTAAIADIAADIGQGHGDIDGVNRMSFDQGGCDPAEMLRELTKVLPRRIALALDAAEDAGAKSERVSIVMPRDSYNMLTQLAQMTGDKAEAWIVKILSNPMWVAGAHLTDAAKQSGADAKPVPMIATSFSLPPDLFGPPLVRDTSYNGERMTRSPYHALQTARLIRGLPQALAYQQSL